MKKLRFALMCVSLGLAAFSTSAQSAPKVDVAKKSAEFNWEACPAGSVHVYIAFVSKNGGGYAVPCVPENQLDTEATMKAYLKAAKTSSGGEDAVIQMVKPLKVKP